MISLRDKVSLITGASSGIGAATAIRFAKCGASLILNGRNEDNLNATMIKCKEAGKGEVLKVVGDVRDSKFLKTMVEKGIDKFKKIDVLVNNAGILVEYSGLEEINMEAFDYTMNINLRSVIELTKLCIPHLIATKGNVVSVSSIAGMKATRKGHLAYGISKAGIDLFTINSAVEFGKRGVRFNAVNPGVIETPLHERSGVTGENYEKLVERIKQSYPLGRLGKPEEVAKLIAFLASDDASFITGDLIRIDGGKGAISV